MCESLRKAHFGENGGIGPLCPAQFSSVLNATENENKAAPLSGLRALSLLLYTADRNYTVNHGYLYVVSEMNMRIHSTAFLHMYVWSICSLCTLREARGHQPTALPLTTAPIPQDQVSH